VDQPELEREIDRFDPRVALARAQTPPASWYTEPAFLERERTAVFRHTWVFACRLDQVARPGCAVPVDVAGDPYVVIRGSDGALRGFHNACRHHGARLIDGENCAEAVVCPYHGWTYSLEGALKSAPRSAGMANFRRAEWGLLPVRVETFGPLVLLHAGSPPCPAASDLVDLAPLLEPERIARFTWVARRTYPMRCNWKVFVDNYLDGGYHIPHLHGNLASQLDLATYETTLFERCNVQTSASHATPGSARGQDLSARIGSGAVYAWIYPNLMLNRYGPILDSNLVVPTGPTSCEVVFDYWYDGDPASARPFLDQSIENSDITQREDVWISEQVQRGLASRAYDRGRYAPEVEKAMHHFHRLLAADLRLRVGRA
jgi:choline monooxygenase